MTPLLLTYSTALLLGTLHALEPDHMAAVTSFAVRRPGPREAVRFGVQWSIGHGGAILVIGGALLMLGLHLPETTTHWMERFVGVVMIGLGIWAYRSARALYGHGPDGHVHAGHGHSDGQGATAVGLVHGLAGSGSAVALIPVLGFDSPAPGMLYLAVFAVGTVAGMALYGLLAGAVFGRAADTSLRLSKLLARLTGVFTVIVGVVWLVR